MKFLLSATIILASPLIAAPVPLLRTAATVNGKMITTREVEQQLAPTVSMLLAKYPRRGDKFREAFVEARNEVLDELIEHKLVLSSLEEKNLQIPEYLVKQDVERFIRINFSGNQEEFRKYLKSIRMTRREFEKSQQEKILVQSFKRQQFKDVAPATDSEIKKRYQKRSSDLRDRSKDVITFRKIYIPSIDQDNPVATQEDQVRMDQQQTLDDKLDRQREISRQMEAEAEKQRQEAEAVEARHREALSALKGSKRADMSVGCRWSLEMMLCTAAAAYLRGSYEAVRYAE